MSNSKKLVVNADDFGLSTAINEGIIAAHVRGIVSSTTMVASGLAFDDAVEKSRLHSDLGLGVHLTLVEENSVASPSQTPTLAPHGVLPASYGELIKGIAKGRIRLAEIEVELRAQIEKCLAAGLQPSHLDSHQHTHAFPFIFRIAVKLANEYKIRGIRIPRGRPGLKDLSANRFAGKCILCLLGQADVFLPRGQCVTTDYFAGIFESGSLEEQSLGRILAKLSTGTTELMCHPGCHDNTPRYANWNLRRQAELAGLTSATVKKAVQDQGIEVVTYREL